MVLPHAWWEDVFIALWLRYTGSFSGCNVVRRGSSFLVAELVCGALLALRTTAVRAEEGEQRLSCGHTLTPLHLKLVGPVACSLLSPQEVAVAQTD